MSVSISYRIEIYGIYQNLHNLYIHIQFHFCTEMKIVLWNNHRGPENGYYKISVEGVEHGYHFYLKNLLNGSLSYRSMTTRIFSKNHAGTYEKTILMRSESQNHHSGWSDYKQQQQQQQIHSVSSLTLEILSQ